jgi:hypothetical protein
MALAHKKAITMSSDNQDKLVKVGGAVVLTLLVLLAYKVLAGDTELLAGIVTVLGTAYGILGYNTPIKAIQNARGLVSVRAPSEHEVVAMEKAVVRAKSVKPPAAEVSQ